MYADMELQELLNEDTKEAQKSLAEWLNVSQVLIWDNERFEIN